MINIEITDTFGGEANYCWVERMEINDNDLTNRQILKRVREKYGITCKLRKVLDCGDMVRYNFDKQNVCMFIEWR